MHILKSALEPCDSIEVVDEGDRVLRGLRFGRVRIREGLGLIVQKASIYLTADQLEDHARACLALATKIRTS